MAIEPLQGHCPVCGAEELRRGFQGLIQCGNTLCERQDAIHSLLTDPELGNHLIRVTKRVRHSEAGATEILDWTIRHPLSERLNDDLFACEMGLYVHAMWDGGSPLTEGTHRVTDNDDGGWDVRLIEP